MPASAPSRAGNRARWGYETSISTLAWPEHYTSHATCVKHSCSRVDASAQTHCGLAGEQRVFLREEFLDSLETTLTPDTGLFHPTERRGGV